MQFLVELFVVVIVVEDKFPKKQQFNRLSQLIVKSSNCESCIPTNTVKQGILYWTCTGPAIEMIGLAPYT